MFRILFAAAACVVVSAPVSAGLFPCDSIFDTVSWQYPSSGTFENNLNWSPASPPGPGDTACFSLDFGVTECLFTFDATCDALGVDAELGSTVTIRSGFFRRELTVQSMEAATFNELRVSDLDVDVTFLDAYGTVRVQNGSSISANRTGVDFNGLLRLEGPGTSLVSVIGISTPSVQVPSSSNGVGTLEVADSASLTTMNLRLAPGFFTSTGASTADLLVETGGSVTADNVYVATGQGDRDATVLLRNPGSRLEAIDELEIGSNVGAGQAIFNMQSGAELDLAATSEIKANGRLDMTDATLVVDQTLNVNGGTFVAANDSTILLSPGVALAVRDGGMIDWARSVTANSPDVNQPIALQVESGALFEITFTCTLGGTAGTRGEATVTGARIDDLGVVVPSTLRGTGGGSGADLRVGTAGQGALEILNGGFVQLRDDGIIGFEAGAEGAVTVSGDFGFVARSTLDLTIAGNAALLSVGENGDGSLDINFGGLVTTGGDAYFGRGLTGVADVVVTGNIGRPATLLVGDDVIAGTNEAGATGSARIHVAGEGLLDANDTIGLRTTGTLELGIGSVVRTGFFSNSGTVEGTGQLDVGSITNGGTIDLQSSDLIEITGDLSLASTGELEIEIDPLTAMYGTVDVGGDLFMGGTLRITTPTGAPVPDGRVLDILTFAGTATGTEFDNVIVPVGSATPVVEIVGQTVRVTFPDLCPEDFDGDGQIGFSDLTQLLSAWGPCVTACIEDLDDDRMVGFSDLTTLLSAWGPC